MPPSTSAPTTRNALWRPFTVVSATLLAPTLAAVLLYHLDSFDPAPMPLHELSPGAAAPTTALLRNNRLMEGAEFLGKGQLVGPEDIAFDPKSELIYTGCQDGWIKRFKLNQSSTSGDDPAVQNWVNTSGRPLGLVLGHNGEIIVADAYKGLLNISQDGTIELLTDEAEGLKFNFTDGVDVAEDGTIYFTDASYKYNYHEFIWDMFEGKPHGRLLSYVPHTKETKVLVDNLYVANGVAVSPNQEFVVFCETTLRRCRKFHLQGEKKGQVEKFVENLSGLPENIRYDGEGHYWIALPTELTKSWELALKYPFIRKALALMERYFGRPDMEKNGGVLAVDLDGKLVAHYYDSGLTMITGGIKIHNHLYCGSLKYPFMIRLNLNDYPARAAASRT